MKNNAIVGAVSSFGKSVSFIQKVQKTVEAQVQCICWIVDMTVCYNFKTAIQTVWNSGGTSDSVVIDWWTFLCDVKTGACVQLLDCSHEVSGFSRLCRSPLSAWDKKSTLGALQMATCLEKPGRVQQAGAQKKMRAPPARPPTQMQPQAQTARTQQVLSATRMSSCFRKDLECRDVGASATGFGPRPLDSGYQCKSEICKQRTDRSSDHSH